jgi:hypothetical protein
MFLIMLALIHLWDAIRGILGIFQRFKAGLCKEWWILLGLLFLLCF